MTGKRKALTALDGNSLEALPRLPSDSDFSSSNWVKRVMDSSKTPKTSNRGGHGETVPTEANNSFGGKLQKGTKKSQKEHNVTTRRRRRKKVAINGSLVEASIKTASSMHPQKHQDLQTGESPEAENVEQKKTVKNQKSPKPPVYRTNTVAGGSMDKESNKRPSSTTDNGVGQPFLPQGETKSPRETTSETESESLFSLKRGRSPKPFNKKQRIQDQVLASPTVQTTTPSRHADACPDDSYATDRSEEQSGRNDDDMDCEPDTASFDASLGGSSSTTSPAQKQKSKAIKDVSIVTNTTNLQNGGPCRGSFQYVTSHTSEEQARGSDGHMDCEPNSASLEAPLGRSSQTQDHSKVFYQHRRTPSPPHEGGRCSGNITMDARKTEGTSALLDAKRARESAGRTEVRKTHSVLDGTTDAECFDSSQNEQGNRIVGRDVRQQGGGAKIGNTKSGGFLSEEENRRARVSIFNPRVSGVARNRVIAKEKKTFVTQGMMERARNRPPDNEQVMKTMMASEPTKLGSNGTDLVGSIIGGTELQQAPSLDESDVTMHTRWTAAAKDVGRITAYAQVGRIPNEWQVSRLGRCPADQENDRVKSRENPISHAHDTVHHHQKAHESEESVVAWSLDDGSASIPIEFTIAGRRFLHPALPPGWMIRVSDKQQRPYYTHPDFGTTWHCPIVLPPKVMHQNLAGDKSRTQSNSRYEEEKTRLQPDLKPATVASEELEEPQSESTGDGDLSETMSELLLYCHNFVPSKANPSEPKDQKLLHASREDNLSVFRTQPCNLLGADTTESHGVVANLPNKVGKGLRRSLLDESEAAEPIEDGAHCNSSARKAGTELQGPAVRQSTPFSKVPCHTPGRPSKSCTSRRSLPRSGQTLGAGRALSPIDENGLSAPANSDQMTKGATTPEQQPTKQNLLDERRVRGKEDKKSLGADASQSQETTRGDGQSVALANSNHIDNGDKFGHEQPANTKNADRLEEPSQDSRSTAADSHTSWVSPLTSGKYGADVGFGPTIAKAAEAQLKEKPRDTKSIDIDSQTSQVSPESPKDGSGDSALRTLDEVTYVCYHRQTHRALPVLNTAKHSKNSQALQEGRANTSHERSPGLQKLASSVQSERKTIDRLPESPIVLKSPTTSTPFKPQKNENGGVAKKPQTPPYRPPHQSPRDTRLNQVANSRASSGGSNASWQSPPAAFTFDNRHPKDQSLHRESFPSTTKGGGEKGALSRNIDLTEKSPMGKQIPEKNPNAQALMSSTKFSGKNIESRPPPKEARGFPGKGHGIGSPTSPENQYSKLRRATPEAGGTAHVGPVEKEAVLERGGAPIRPELVAKGNQGNPGRRNGAVGAPASSVDSPLDGQSADGSSQRGAFQETEGCSYFQGSDGTGDENRSGLPFSRDGSAVHSDPPRRIEESISSKNVGVDLCIPDMVTFKSPGLSSIVPNSNSSFSNTLDGSFDAVTPCSNISGKEMGGRKCARENDLGECPHHTSQGGGCGNSDNMNVDPSTSANPSRLVRHGSPSSNSGFGPTDAGNMTPESTILHTPEDLTHKKSYRFSLPKSHRDATITGRRSSSLPVQKSSSAHRALTKRAKRSSRSCNMGHRVLHPPLPLCSLQNLDALKMRKRTVRGKRKKSSKIRRSQKSSRIRRSQKS